MFCQYSLKTQKYVKALIWPTVLADVQVTLKTHNWSYIFCQDFRWQVSLKFMPPGGGDSSSSRNSSSSRGRVLVVVE
jgi:hypothetical protein